MRSNGNNKMIVDTDNKLAGHPAIAPCPPGYDDDGGWELVHSRTGNVTGWYHHQTHGFKELMRTAAPDPISNVPAVKKARLDAHDITAKLDAARETWLAASTDAAELRLAQAHSEPMYTSDHQLIYAAEDQQLSRKIYAAEEQANALRGAYDQACMDFAHAQDHLRRTEAQALRTIRGQ